MVRFIPRPFDGLVLLILVASAMAQESTPTFGTTVVDSSGFRGDIYAIPVDTEWLPKFKKLPLLGTIYTSSLNVPGRSFTEGFPGVTDRLEWFAILYRAKFWVTQTRAFRFALESDDGSKLYIDNRLVIDNDGGHAPFGCIGQAELAQGPHEVRVEYFQGPRFYVALMLGVTDENGSWHIFDTRSFRPPPHFNTAPPAHAVRKIRRGNCWAR